MSDDFVKNVLFSFRMCPVCGINYAVTREFIDKKRETGEPWRCPNGDSLSFGDSELKQAEDKISQLVVESKLDRVRKNNLRERLYASQKSLSATRGWVTKLKKARSEE